MAACRDISGRRNHGVYIGNPRSVPGALANDDDPAREFGPGRYVTADRVIRDLPPLGLSFGCWMRPTQNYTGTAGGAGVLALNTRPGTTGPYGGVANRGILSYGGTRHPRHIYWDPGYTDGTPDILGPELAPNEAWHFVVLTFDLTCQLFVDGASVGTSAMNPANTVAADDRFSMGQEWDTGPSDFFDGYLDEVFMLDRPITAGEVAELYAVGTGAVVGDYRGTVLGLSGLVGYWRLNDRGGWVVGSVGR